VTSPCFPALGMLCSESAAQDGLTERVLRRTLSVRRMGRGLVFLGAAAPREA